MNVEELREFCLSLPAVDEYLPFDEHTLAFRVGGESGKIFCLTGLDNPQASANLKCDPEKAVELREKYAQIVPGYHMNKQHWNTVYLDDGLNQALLESLIRHSHELVYRSLPAKLRAQLES
ncbi:MAG: MmcQ/YjbR family DNA-binding protein [Saprospiraceae bacterium]|nr:MmcQ/YjbR family DNA-binding protein [Saprospiraceae bacterium]